MRYAKRKAACVHILRLHEHSQQGRAKDEAAWNPKAATLQELRPQVHAAASEADGRIAVNAVQYECAHAGEKRTPDIVQQALCMAEAVSRFGEQARQFYYEVMLSGHSCPNCNGSLEMMGEGQCRCLSCDRQFDPTPAFQRCSACGGTPRLNVRRYSCSQCRADVPSRFLFDGLVFDAEYFRQKMAESRAHKQELRERVRQMLAESRSDVIQPGPVDLASAPGLLDALNLLVYGPDPTVHIDLPATFSLSRYQAHVQAHLRPFTLNLDDLPPLSENTRLDRIWRFIAIIFLAHAGIVDVWQDGPTIVVKQHEINAERPGVPGSIEEADGIA